MDARELKDEAARAMGRGQWKTALGLYAELARLEPREGSWPLRAGDAARRLGQHAEAVSWYERAAATYGESGFTVRAIAVGRMIEGIDPGNDRVLRALDAAESRPAIPLKPKALARAPAVPPPLPPRLSRSEPGGPPLSGRLTGPPLAAASREPSLTSVEIVFEDVDDGIPIEEASILLREEWAIGVVGEDAAEQVLEALPAFPIFEILPRGAFLDLVSELEPRSYAPGEVVVRQGEPGTSLFAIVDGEAVVFAEGRRDQPLAMLETGDVFGEMALVLDQPRGATVEAQTPLEVLELDRELLRTITEEHPELGDVLSRMIKRRLVENVMATAPLFQDLDPAARRELMSRFEVREAPAGTRLVEQGTAADGLYVVLAGEVVALRTFDEGARPVATLGPGQVLGAAALLDPSQVARSSFEARRASVALRLPRSAFNEVVCAYPLVLERLSRIADEQAHWHDGDSVSVV